MTRNMDEGTSIAPASQAGEPERLLGIALGGSAPKDALVRAYTLLLHDGGLSSGAAGTAPPYPGGLHQMPVPAILDSPVMITVPDAIDRYVTVPTSASERVLLTQLHDDYNQAIDWEATDPLVGLPWHRN